MIKIVEMIDWMFLRAYSPLLLSEGLDEKFEFPVKSKTFHDSWISHCFLHWDDESDSLRGKLHNKSMVSLWRRSWHPDWLKRSVIWVAKYGMSQLSRYRDSRDQDQPTPP